MSRLSGHQFVIGRQEAAGEIQDVRIQNNAEGLTEIRIARDPLLTGERTYVVDRRILPHGSWRRLLEIESFSRDAEPERLAEVRASVEFEQIANTWRIEYERCWGLPLGMESPWEDALEMVANELLLPEGAKWVSGVAPVSIETDGSYSNGKYTVSVESGVVHFYSGSELLGSVETDTSHATWTDGLAGSCAFRGGSIYAEPAKPIQFTGTFVLDRDATLERPGLYRVGDHYLISSTRIIGRAGIGTIAFVKDPFPNRWVPRMMGRAYVDLVSPANRPPYIEDMPERISVSVHRPETDFPEIEPEVTTPYADETGVFNSWTIESGDLSSVSLERPYDLYLPLERIEDWGGRRAYATGDFFPATDFEGDPDAAYPSTEGYELSDLPPINDGTLFFRWKDSGQFDVITSRQLDVSYKEGYLYFTDRDNHDNDGIAKLEVSTGWNATKVEWGADGLFVNDEPASMERNTWGEFKNATWGDLADYSEGSDWTPSADIPITTEQRDETPVTWMTGRPEGEAPIKPITYERRPKTWGRVLFEDYTEEDDSPIVSINASSDSSVDEVGEIPLRWTYP